jgi:hypothetical protein
MLPTLKNRKWFQSIQSRAPERIPIELRMNERDVMHQTFDGWHIQQITERTAFLD